MDAERKKFPHVQGRDCVTSAMRNLLAWYGHPISEPVIFGLGSGLNYWFSQIAGCPVPAILGTNLVLEEDLCSRLGIEFEIREPSCPAEADEVYDVVEAGTPVIVKADPYYFDCCWEGLPQEHRQHFGEHVTVVVSIQDGYAWLSDIWRNELVQVPLDELRAARSSTDGYQFLLARNRWYAITMPDKIDWKQELVPAAHACAQSMLEGRGLFGVAGIANSGAALVKWFDETAVSDVACYLNLIAQRMDEGATGSCFRALFAEFLLESGELLGREELASMGERWLTDVVPLWKQVIAELRQAANEGPNSREKLVRLPSIFLALAKLEGDLCRTLLSQTLPRQTRSGTSLQT